MRRHDELLEGLRAALVGASFAPLARWYGHRTAFDNLSGRRRESARGVTATSRLWRRVIGGPGEVTHWWPACAEGGCEVDVQRSPSAGGSARPLRQLHRLHVEDGVVTWHLVFPAPPRESTALPAAAVGRIIGGTLEEVQHAGFSSARLYRGMLGTGQPVVVKQLEPGSDWMARATRDAGREGLLHDAGVYDALPPRLRSPVIHAEQVGSGWLIVMRDVTAGLRVIEQCRTRDSHDRILGALKDLHAVFSGKVTSPALCSVAERLRLFSPARWLVERHGDDTLPKTFLASWEAFADRAEPDLARAVLRLVDDPTGLLVALEAEQEYTLLHGDYRPANLSLEPGGVVALDWGLASHGPPQLDFVWYLSHTAWDGDDERAYLEAIWERVSGLRSDSRASDLAVVYHAVMGEIGYLLNEVVHQPRGFPRPSPATATWWLRRTREAFDRLGELA